LGTKEWDVGFNTKLAKLRFKTLWLLFNNFETTDDWQRVKAK
jgi:hypothetical protein